MVLQMKGPVPHTHADNRAGKIECFRQHIDTEINNPYPTQSLAIKKIAERHRLSHSAARIVCELAGIGGTNGL